ncbi:hypothetical protein FE782_29915 [Paenibacillus antri]|uniref:Uncharacterized protein n=1 Tax=Paenibacillus antri TaxID=2582848 RepID=A0A5R9FYH1_9BACL|nr:hypothetical protein [Paenibacillus antri]TLS48531.1 hypothetical protein FE782_29915 [Paenibacillus antri]
MNRLKQIEFVFPAATEEERRWNRTFRSVMAGSAASPNEAVFLPKPEGALPTTAFREGGYVAPAIALDVEATIDLRVGAVALADRRTLEARGSAMPASSASISTPAGLPIEALQRLLSGRVVAVDHTGFNVPTSSIAREAWDRLLRTLASAANLYRYPGEDWPFLFPSTSDEFAGEIASFDAYRTAKFELVYDGWTKLPLLQFALSTTLTREEAEAALPGPHGFGIPGLDGIFRSAFVDSPWRDAVAIRFDLYYARSDAALTDWETGEWLVREGGRIRAADATEV